MASDSAHILQLSGGPQGRQLLVAVDTDLPNGDMAVHDGRLCGHALLWETSSLVVVVVLGKILVWLAVKLSLLSYMDCSSDSTGEW